MSAQEQRMFYLMLSPAQGQEFASELGFPTASEDVEEAETMDVIARWALITVSGLLEEIIQSADWLCELQSKVGDVNEDVREAFHKTVTSYAVALLNKLLDSNKLVLVMEESDDE